MSPKRINTGTTSSGDQGPTNPRGGTIPTCPTRGKAHWGQCHRDMGACFKCGQVGHLLKDCPKRTTPTTVFSGLVKKPARSRRGRKDQKCQGWAFALVPGKWEVTKNVMLGILSVCGHLAHVLIDSRSTHSFAALHFAVKLASTPEPVGYILSVSFLSGNSILSTDVYKSCTISLKGKTLYVDLIPLCIGNFDMILGMDWLVANHASVDCKAKKVSLRLPNKLEFVFDGTEISTPPCLISSVTGQ